MNKSSHSAISIIFLVIVLCSCSEKRLIRDRASAEIIESNFEEAKNLAINRYEDLFQIFDKGDLSRAEEDALKFYLASMPLNDLADYNSDFFLENINASLRARDDYPWSSKIPEDIYLHYVLPIRVNNENLDSFRLKYYDELFNRINGIRDIESAALEINHWCHEKVSYQSADIRTSAPMSTILSSRGRCGEESTLTVAALRTVGIPARQVYVPRWSHSDDNHAWVEIWIKGEWNYFGACEPEAHMNIGWFTAPASRAMLVHSKSFGEYLGKEPIVKNYEYYSEINMLGLYADIKPLVVKVIDKELKPVREAQVEYKIYNYAEYYTLAKLKTDSAAYTSFLTGYGDFLIWCSKDGHYGYDIVSASETDTVNIIIGSEIPNGNSLKLNLSAPVSSRLNPVISDSEAQRNKIRLAEEDLIREEYISSWISSEDIEIFADKSGYDPVIIAPILKRSMGNYNEIICFLESVEENRMEDAIDLLNIIADKDLRDTPMEVLSDHLISARHHFTDRYNEELFVEYVLNPRIANEILRPWRLYIQSQQNSQTIEAFQNNPLILADWMKNNLKIEESKNYYRVPISPRGVLELGVSDKLSRDIFFVACCRSCGIPSRLEPGTEIPQYFLNGSWNDVIFEEEKSLVKSAKLTLSYNHKSDIPKYYIHFTLAYLENGTYKTLKFAYNKKADEFDWPLNLIPGNYILSTGNRLSDTEILSEIIFFELTENEEKVIDLSIRSRELVSPVIGKLDMDSKILTVNGTKSVFDKLGTGSVIAWINPEREPSKHLLNELKHDAEDLNNWGGEIYLVSDTGRMSNSNISLADYGLPDKTVIAYDPGLELLTSLFPLIDHKELSLPMVIFINTENQITFKSEGYQIGLGQQLLKQISAQKD